MKRTIRIPVVALYAAVLAACASGPTRSPELVRLHGELDRLHADPRVAANAEIELARAGEVIDLLERNAGRLDDDWYLHNLYVADRLVRTAEAAGLARYAEERGTTLGAERDRLLVDLQARQSARALAEAGAAQAEADAARAQARAAEAESELLRERERANSAELDAMRVTLIELQARETERGLVVTLGDVLFEVDRADLKAGAARNLDKLVAALRNDPDSRVEIEGHTDSTGARSYNLDLSQRRAAAVHAYLVTHGIGADRVVVRGLGPDYPVASNNTESGRQQNRRVEVIVQTEVALDTSDD